MENTKLNEELQPEVKVSYSRVLKVTSPLMYGEDVRAVQNKLNSLGHNAGTVDGYYGNGTANAVRDFSRYKWSFCRWDGRTRN